MEETGNLLAISKDKKLRAYFGDSYTKSPINFEECLCENDLEHETTSSPSVIISVSNRIDQ